ncbi:DUF732 domain-containing protein [Streptomyces subrutilus]|uniref:DUF732 domain-containing protein n=1 Tax=Streptomyces subrutilus TaxID=36818 RepID=A0A1E5PLD4_9ACTN|nr:DUF732 domain-containing protein [Streptomyces subrutilus]OEJ30357.1 hypothetical protein BGK67_02395 [Streptomyces subrutilus]
MRPHHTLAIATAALLLALTGCSDADADRPGMGDEGKPKPTPSAPSSAPAADPEAAPSAAGLPPSPAPAQRTIYLAALNGIDPEIVGGDDDRAISRGLNQCQSMKDEKDPTKRVESTNRRFTSPNQPDGFGPTKAAFILAAVQTNLCPTY